MRGTKGKYFLSLHQTNHNWKVQTWDWNHASTASDQSDAPLQCNHASMLFSSPCKQRQAASDTSWNDEVNISKYYSNWSKIAVKCIPLKVVCTCIVCQTLFHNKPVFEDSLESSCSEGPDTLQFEVAAPSISRMSRAKNLDRFKGRKDVLANSLHIASTSDVVPP